MNGTATPFAYHRTGICPQSAGHRTAFPAANAGHREFI
ncbi:hypothetical protein T261_5429 [Streptomyces lydicus]|nr:hypothetical protein T261_5429 [Streptomyces lydicus]